MATIAIAGSAKVRRNHNIRAENCVAREKHIKKNGNHETFVDVDLKQFYKDTFLNAQQEYDSNKSPTKQVGDYLRAIRRNPQKHECYELIVGVYKGPDEATQKQILKEFLQNFLATEKNMKIVGAYYHADEDAEPHLHLDYVPVAYNCKRGMKVQNSMSQALKEMNYKARANNRHESAQVVWQEHLRDELTKICSRYNIQVERGISEHKHLETAAFKEYTKNLKELANTIYSLDYNKQENLALNFFQYCTEVADEKDYSHEFMSLQNYFKVLKNDRYFKL